MEINNLGASGEIDVLVNADSELHDTVVQVPEVVPFQPSIDDQLVNRHIADWTPEPTRKAENLDLEDTTPDDPRRVFDNSFSNVPWADFGRFDTSEQLVGLFNADSTRDPLRGRVLGTLGNIFSFSGRYWSRMKSVPVGHFKLVHTQTGEEIRMRGESHLLSTLSHWGDTVPIDDEQNDIRTYGNKTILQVRANHLGCAFLVGDRTKPDGSILGKDGDLVLFSQGRYVLREDQIRQVTVAEIRHDQHIIRLGDSSTVLNVPPEYIGVARHRNTNRWHLVKTGAPAVFDNKEWADYAVVERKRETFEVGPFVFVTVSADEVASIGHKNGNHLLLTEEGTYQFHKERWEVFEKHKNEGSFDIAGYYVRTVERNQVGTVASLVNGEFRQLQPGKYFLPMKSWAQPDVATLDQPIVTSGRWHWVRVEEDFRVGARNAQTGEWVEWTDTGELVKVHMRDFPLIERIRKVSLDVQQFGPNKVITVPDGKWGVFQESGKIQIQGPGTYDLTHATQILPQLPSTPQELYLEVPFLSKDTIQMSVRSAIYYSIEDAKALAQKLNSTGLGFQEWKQILTDYCLQTVEQSVKVFDHSQLYNPEDQKTARLLYDAIMQHILSNLNAYAEKTGMGLSFSKAEFTDGFRVLNQSVLDDRAKLTTAALDAKASEAQAEANRQKAKADAVAAIEEAQREKEVSVLNEQAKRDVELLTLEQERAKAEQEFKLKVEREKADAEAAKLKAAAEQAVKQMQAEADAYAIKATAEAEYERLSAQNKAASERPAQETALEVGKLYVEASRAMGDAAWAHPQPTIEALQRLGDIAKSNPWLTLASLNQPTIPAIEPDEE